jgi:hypothetical protein
VLQAAAATNESVTAAVHSASEWASRLEKEHVSANQALAEGTRSLQALCDEARSANRRLVIVSDAELQGAGTSRTALTAATSAAKAESEAYSAMRKALSEEVTALQETAQLAETQRNELFAALQNTAKELQLQTARLAKSHDAVSKSASLAAEHFTVICQNAQHQADERVANVERVADSSTAAQEAAAATSAQQVKAATAAISAMRSEADAAEAAGAERQRILAQELQQLREALSTARAATLRHDREVRSREGALAEDIRVMQQRQLSEDAAAAAAFAGERKEWEDGVAVRQSALRNELAATRCSSAELVAALSSAQALHESDVQALQGRVEELYAASEQRLAANNQERAAAEASLQQLQLHANDVAAAAANERARLVASLAAAYSHMGMHPPQELAPISPQQHGGQG